MSCNCTNQCKCVDPCSDTQIRRIVDDAVADRIEDMEDIASSAQGSATASENSATQSAQSATQSQQFATTAGNNATAAAQSAQQAAVSATAAAESATAAVKVTTGLTLVAEELADSSKRLSDKIDDANANAEAAETARDEAVAAATSATASSTAATSAATSATTAATTATNTLAAIQTLADGVETTNEEFQASAALASDKIDTFNNTYSSAISELTEIQTNVQDLANDTAASADSALASASSASTSATTAIASAETAQTSAANSVALAEAIQNGITVRANEAAILATSPTSVQVAQAMDTLILYYWNGASWTNLGITLDNWAKDLKTFDSLVTGDAATVTNREGTEYPNWAKVVEDFKRTGGVLAFETTASLLAFTPATANVLALAADTSTYYLWNGTAWHNAGSGFVDKETLDSIITDSSSATYFMRWMDDTQLVLCGWKTNSNGDIFFVSPTLNFGSDGFKGNGVSLTTTEVSNSDFSLERNEVINGDVFRIRDESGTVILRIKEDGQILSNAESSSTTEVTESSLIQQLEVNAQKAKAKRFNTGFFPIPRANALKKLMVWIIYGQSFSVGAGATVGITGESPYGNLMLGQSVRGSHYSNTDTEYTYGPVGGENTFYILKEVPLYSEQTSQPTLGAYGETIASGFANELKYRHNQRKGVVNDENYIIAPICCGVAGRSITQLSKGASPELYNRVITALSGAAEAAAKLGYAWEVQGIIYMQGENDNSQSYSYYKPKLQQMHDDLVADCMAATGQVHKPIFMLNQMGNNYISNMNTGVVNAQIGFADENPNVVLMGSYGGTPYVSAYGHLFANGYRWIGAQYAKEADRKLNGLGECSFKMLEAKLLDGSVYASFATRVAPLQFKSTIVKQDVVNYVDKGFTIVDSTGTIVGSDLTVSIVSDNVIKITPSRELYGAATLYLGDGTNHAGTHNITDSDTEISMYTWQAGLAYQPALESIPSLNGNNYELVNRALIQSISISGV